MMMGVYVASSIYSFVIVESIHNLFEVVFSFSLFISLIICLFEGYRYMTTMDWRGNDLYKQRKRVKVK